MRILVLSTFLVGVGVAGLSASWAQDDPPAPKPKDPPEKTAESDPPADDTRDPFDSTPTIDAALGDDEKRAEFVRDEAPTWTPRIRLRGYAEDADGKTIATLEVDDGSTHIVRTGDTVTHYEGRRSVVLRVMRIENLQVLVEVGRLRQAIIVR